MTVRSLISVHRLRYFRFCNVLHIWTIRAIPTYRVYRLYDRDRYQLTIVQVELNCAKLSLSLSLPLLIHTYGVTLSDFLWKAISSSCMQMCVCACWGCVWYTSTYGVCVCVVCEMCVWYTSTYGVCVCCVCVLCV